MKTRESLLRLRLDDSEVPLVLASEDLHNAKQSFRRHSISSCSDEIQFQDRTTLFNCSSILVSQLTFFVAYRKLIF